MDNTRLAQFIVSFGGLNSYGSTIAQTKQALDMGKAESLNSFSDVGLFEDALAGISAARKNGFTVEGIIAINKSFTHNEDEDPDIPGHLRNSLYNSDDNISVAINKRGNEYYFPPEQVTKNDLQRIINTFKQSKQTRFDALHVFAEISKLQPFQDGNKRTALIAANAALNTWDKEDYLLLPLSSLDQADFMVNLMRYYKEDDLQQQTRLLLYMQKLMPNILEQKSVLPKDNQDVIDRVKTTRIKPLFKKNI